MARRERSTAPLHSKVGTLDTYEEQEPHLVAAEWRGRHWAFAQAKAHRRLDDFAILDLHEAMFAPLLDWAGQTRNRVLGEGGRVVVLAMRGRFVDEDGNPLARVP